MKTDNTLISKVAQGDKNALNEIYILYSRKVYNIILNRYNDRSLADDITQEVFITVYEKAINFRGDSQVSTWIFRIAINKSLDELKKKKKTNDYILKEPYQTIENEDDSRPSENLTTILRAIDELKQNQKQAFTLVYLDKIHQQEAAEILNMNIKAFESLLYRARLSLQKTLSKTKDF